MISTPQARPQLIPRPGHPVINVTAVPQFIPTPREWKALYPEIERLYIHERRKLRYIMQYMEKVHGFKATTQMYKKRFTKWGFQKNRKRSSSVALTSSAEYVCTRRWSSKSSTPRDPISLHGFLGLGHHDSLGLVFLTNVRTSSMAFYESAQPREGVLLSFEQQPSIDDSVKEVSFTFKLAIDLLDRGCGDLGGKAARKAFMMVESILTMEGPVLVWNLLEMMHHMLVMHHAQLFKMLLAYLIALVGGRFPRTHPLSVMLFALRDLVASLSSAGATPESDSANSSASASPTSSPTNDRSLVSAESTQLSRTLTSLIERGWILNAEILFNHFDLRFFHLYCRVHCASCSIPPPTAIFQGIDQWHSSRVSADSPPDSASLPPASNAKTAIEITLEEKDSMLQCMLSPHGDTPPPPHAFAKLRAGSIATLREHGDHLLNRMTEFTGNTITLLSLVAVLVTTDVLEVWPGTVELSFPARGYMNQIPRAHAEHLACVMSTLMELDPKYGGMRNASTIQVIDQLRSIVALREYARGETFPQLIQEILMLKDALTVAGQYKEAQEVWHSALRRVERYTQDIPTDFN